MRARRSEPPRAHRFSNQGQQAARRRFGRIALVLYRLLRDHHIALYDDEALLTELARVQLREQAPGVYRIDHAHGEHDDRAVALAMCAHSLLDRPAHRGGVAVTAAGHNLLH